MSVKDDDVLPMSLPIKAGFPNPAEEANFGSLNLHSLLVTKPASTFFMRAEGDSLRLAGVNNGDILVVDRSASAKNGDVVVVAVDGEFGLRQLLFRGKHRILVTPDESTTPLLLTPEADYHIWGVVTSVVHDFRKGEYA